MCGYIKDTDKNDNNWDTSRCYGGHGDGYDPTVYNLKVPIGIELIDEGDVGDGLVLNYNNYDYYYDYENELQDTFWDAVSLIKDKDWEKFND
mgnify:CR=1 FL=1